jgi:peptidoglycan/LPS O-acetylase OafA/YrhL
MAATFSSDYVVGLLVAANFVGFRALEYRVAPALVAIEKPIRFAASCTFSLYLYHSPLLHFVWVFVPQDSFVALAIALPAAVGLASLTEWKKDNVHRALLHFVGIWPWFRGNTL